MVAASLPLEQFQNINISAYRVLFILLVLVRYRSLNLVELNRLLYENPVIGRGYNSDTLTKYINTLREVGCRIPRSTNRNDYSYELLKSPFPLSLDSAEIRVARKLLDLLSSQPDETLYQDYRQFLESLAWSSGNRDMAFDMDEPPVDDFPFQELDVWRQRFNEYRAYCQDAFSLELSYRKANDELTHCLFEPYEVIERGSQLLLLGLDRTTQEQSTLDIQSIVSVRQLPAKNRRPPVQITVMFVLYGRLANSYRLYPDEKVIYRSDKEVQIKTRVTEPSGLILRLMKYGASCQVLSPDSVREAIRLRIASKLEVLLDNE